MIGVLVAAKIVAVGSVTVICAPYTAIVEELTALGEVYDSSGASIDHGAATELWSNKPDRTYHLIKKFPNGVACILDAGVDWKFGDGM